MNPTQDEIVLALGRKIKEWADDRSSEKVKLKRRVQELEQENAILRSVLGLRGLW